MTRTGHEKGASRPFFGDQFARRVAAAVLLRPHLWTTAAIQAWRLARPGWWRRWPPLPLPDPDWLRFRMQTAYGDPDHPPQPADVVAWLEWCRRWRRLR